jgi:hypothetical protein
VSATKDSVVPKSTVDKTVAEFSTLSENFDQSRVEKLITRLSQRQPELLSYANRIRNDYGDDVGEVAMFYSMLIWSFFDRSSKNCPRLTGQNMIDADDVVKKERAQVPALSDMPVFCRIAPALSEGQPHVYAKLSELLADDVEEGFLPEGTVNIIFPYAQAVVEAFTAAIDGRRPGLPAETVTRAPSKKRRNEQCACGSGKKYKKCCG